MELRQLRYFVAIHECGSISRAARQVGGAQSALSQQLVLLETELAAQLVLRSPRGITLTDAGRELLDHATSMLRQAEDARVAVGTLAQAPRGRVTVGIPPSVPAQFGCALIRNAAARFPDVRLVLSEAPMGQLREQLHRGTLHLAILFEDGQNGEFARKRLLSEPLVLVGRLLDGGRPMGLAAALSQPLLVPAHRQGTRAVLEELATECGVTLDVLAEIDSLAVMRAALLDGVGVAILPRSAVADLLGEGRLVARPLEPTQTRELVLCASARVPVIFAARSVSKLVVTTARELCAQGHWPDAVVLRDNNAFLVR